MIEVDSSEVIRLILQFLRDNNLPDSVKTVSKESGVFLNVIKDKHSFILLAKELKWDLVLEEVEYNLCLDRNVLSSLYRTIYFDFVRKNEISTARSILRDSVLKELKDTDPEEYVQLESFLTFEGNTEEVFNSCHIKLITQLEQTLEQTEPNRLLQIIQDSIKLHSKDLNDSNLKYSVFTGLFVKGADGADATAHIPFAHRDDLGVVLCGSERYLFIGNSQGTVQILDWATASIHSDFEFTSERIQMNCPITFITERNSMLAVGTEDGSIGVWRVDPNGTIKQVTLFDKILKGPVTSLCLSNELVACSSVVCLVLGLRSGGILRQLSTEHIRYVTLGDSLIYGASRNKLFIFNAHYELIGSHSFNNHQITHLLFHAHIGCILNGFIYASGNTRPFGNAHSYRSSSSPKGHFIYQATDKALCIYSKDGIEMRSIPFERIKSVYAHPTFNIVAISTDTQLLMLRP